MAASETILLTVDIQANNARLAELQKQLLEAKTANTALNQSFKEGRITQDELATAQVRLKQETAGIANEQNILYKINLAQTVANRQATAATEAVTAKTVSLSTALRNTAKENSLLNSVMGQASGVQARFAQAQELAKSALGGTTTATNVFRVSLLALPIFAIVAALTALYSYLTKTQEGLDFVERKTKGVTVVLGVLTDKVSAVGKVLFDAFSNPKQAAADLVSFLETNLLNRLKAFGVLVDAIANRDFSKLGDGIVQLGTGVTDAGAKARAFTADLQDAAAAGESIAKTNQQIRDAERALNVERAKSRAQVEALKFLAEDQSKSSKARADAARNAFAIEQEQERKAIELQQRRIDNIRKEQALTNNLTADNDELASQEIKLAGVQEAARTRQIELNNKVNEIQKSQVAANKAARDKQKKEAEEASKKELEARQAALKSEIGLLDERLRVVESNTDEELRLRTEKLKAGYELELTAGKLTAEQKTVLAVKYENDRSELEADYLRRRAAVEIGTAIDSISARLAAVRKGTDEETALRTQLIEQQRQQTVAAISEQATDEERAAKVRLANANTEQQQRELLLEQRTKAVKTFYQQESNELEQAKAAGLVGEQQYQTLLYQIELGSAAARRKIAEDLGDDVQVIDQETTNLKIKNQKRVTDETRTQAAKQADLTQQIATLAGQFFVDALDDAGTALETFAARALLVLLDSVEKSIIASQVKILTDSFAQADSIATFGATGGIRAAIIIAAVAAATGPLKSLLTSSSSSSSSGKSFAEGGQISGPGTSTSDSIPAYGPGDTVVPTYRLSASEHVLTAVEVANMGGHTEVEKMRAMYRQPGAMPVLSWLSTAPAGSQRSFAIGGGVGGYTAPAPTFDGGLAQRSMTEGNTGIDYDKLGRALAQYMPTEIGFKSWVKARDGYEAPRNRASIGRRKS